MSIKNVVLIAGVHGVSGRAAAERWISLPGTRVYGLSRRVAPLPPGVEAVNADLFDRDDVERKLGQISGITHIVFGAYVEKPTASERSEANLAILKNLVDVVERTSPSTATLFVGNTLATHRRSVRRYSNLTSILAISDESQWLSGKQLLARHPPIRRVVVRGAKTTAMTMPTQGARAKRNRCPTAGNREAPHSRV